MFIESIKIPKRLAAVFFSLVFSLPSFSDTAVDPQILPPTVSVVTRHDVDILTGYVQINHPTVSVGDLSDSVSTRTSSWLGDQAVFSGPAFRYSGILTTTPRETSENRNAFWLIASDGTTTVYFDAGTDSNVPTPQADGTYRPVGPDLRYSLFYDAQAGGYVMVKPNGTRIIYASSQTKFNNMQDFPWAHMTEIRSPNGHVTKIKYGDKHRPESVKTNTGFQLRYYFVEPQDPSSDPYGWWASNAAFVYGINNALRYCPHSGGVIKRGESMSKDCDVGGWPHAQFKWPAHTPIIFRESQSAKFSIVNVDGTQADYYHRAASDETGLVVANRIWGVKPANADVITRRYEFRNIPVPGIGGRPYTPIENLAMVRSSKEIDDEITYSPVNQTQQGTYVSSGGYKSVNQVHQLPYVSYNHNPGGQLSYVYAWNSNAWFNNLGQLERHTNLITRAESEYIYDSRGNVQSVTTQGVSTTASYLPSCTSANSSISNWPICNKPVWTKTASGAQTDYEYYPATGQVKTVTYPANNQGVRKRIRYKYGQNDSTPYYAMVLSASGVKQQARDGIWLLREEKTCANSATVGSWPNQSCAGGDEITTSYEYEHDNLLLTSIKVFSQADNSFVRSCYYYDKLGNKVGETAPKLNLQVCPNE